MSNLKELIKKIKRLAISPLVAADFIKFKKLSVRKRFSLEYGDMYPCPFDKTFTTHFDRHYIYHTAWAARVLSELKPIKHYDIGSSLFFSGIVSAFVPITFFDIRLADLELSNFDSRSVDLNKLPFSNDSVSSLSCMHVVEHVGLGRYGDPLDPDGDLKAISELKRVLAVGGSLLFVVPLGKPRIMFNAHRIYSYEQIIEQFKDFKVKQFAFIPETSGGMIINANSERVAQENYGCGCFWFEKLS